MSASQSTGDARRELSELAQGQTRWYAPTVAKYLCAVLLLQLGLYLSEQYRWFSFNEYKGYTVVLVVAATSILLPLMFAWIVASRFVGGKLQFDLATLMLIVLVIAVPLSWLARELHLARQQRDVAALHSRGYHSSVRYNYSSPDELAPPFVEPRIHRYLVSVLGDDFFGSLSDVTVLLVTDDDLKMIGRLTHLQHLDIRSTEVTDQGLRHLRGLTDLQSLSLYRANITDEGLQYLGGLTRLRKLHLDGASQVTDAGVEKLQRLTRLHELGLSYTAVSDAGLKRIAQFTELDSLDLEATQVTSAGLVELQPLVNLQELGLSHTLVDDAGLVHLYGLTQLERVTLKRAQVTDDGVKKLKEALPECVVDRYGSR